jgi:broad specificity phosphatase PhoE
MKIVLIRHSQTSPTSRIPVSLWGLSHRGVRLARELSRKKTIKALDIIYSSLQTKALETAIILAKPNAIPVRTHAGLDEISSFTRKFLSSEYEKKIKDFYNGKISRIQGGETYRKALKRFLKAIREIVKAEKRNGASSIGIVSHGNILAFFSSLYCPLPPLRIHQIMRMPDVAVLNWDQKKFIKLYGEKI